MASMNPELELMIFMTPIFTDKAELALEVFNTDLPAYEYFMFHHPSIHTHAKLPTNQHCITNDIHDGLYEPNFLSDI